MLNPNSERLDYGQLLSAPDGYKLDFAVGTTYSLDLDALVGACIALGLSEETDSDLMKNPICLLEALRTTGDKVALFCEGGQIHMPNKVTPLYILLEQMVFQVNTVKRAETKGYPSFHPKFWLIRYINEKKDVLYRSVVLSRNLTFDRSWDVAFYMDGSFGQAETEKNIPVQDFLSFLEKHLGDDENSKQKSKKLKAIIRELPKVNFDTGSKEFHDYEFLPTGIRRSSGGYYSIKDTNLFHNFGGPSYGDGLHETFIMSPFVSNDVIKYFNERSRYIEHANYVLVTRAMSLGRLKPADCSNFRIYTMKDAVVEGEQSISESGEMVPGQKQDIHAKIYMTRKYSETDLYVGSLNASHNAVFGNVEFMLCLHSKNRYLNMEKLTTGIFCGDEGGADNPFQQAELIEAVVDEEEETKGLLDGIIKRINRMRPTASVMEAGDFYDVSLRFEKAEDIGNYDVMITPLLANKPMPFAPEMLFTSIPLTDLSEFYVIYVADGAREVSRVIKVPTEGMPEGREKAVVSAVVNDKACFYRYVAFLLGDSFVLSALESNEKNQSGKHGIQATAGLPPLYEKMLQTAATAPERFKELDYLIQAVSKDGIVPEYFEELYNMFRKAVKL